ncbi:single-stranded DNA-binding protein [Sphingobacterium faecium]|uniref:single-stranded DNA-binding protein n=1 Tax=Sphingobacterium faecium TaxID=34087 RepID=UPI00247A4106|nr:single-stranded DNA-binding protein [Sphingobacterium faecium]WGQ15611.1 single-stranded DNA-binding protein [Sphingobacterium faecium]
MNSITLLGRIGRDPETRTFENGSVTSFSLATSEVFKDKNGDRQEKTEWHNISFWGKQGELIAKYFKKGDPILMNGRLTYREYKEEGVRRIISEIVGKSFEFLPKSSGVAQNASEVVDNSNNEDDLPF